MNLEFRPLKADEIDCRVATVSEKFFSLLLYKDARVDMVILDETVGSLNWKREHTRDNANCIVSIWDNEKKQWISKEDTGTESFTEKEKGLASDSFKRACFNWGIGRELYTVGDIRIFDSSYIKSKADGKKTIYEKFKVKSIKIVDYKIVGIVIVDSNDKEVFKIENKIKITKEEMIERLMKEQTTEELSNFVEELIADNKKKNLYECTVEEIKDIAKKLKAKKGA